MAVIAVHVQIKYVTFAEYVFCLNRKHTIMEAIAN